MRTSNVQRTTSNIEVNAAVNPSLIRRSKLDVTRSTFAFCLLLCLCTTGCTRFGLLDSLIYSGGYHRTANIAYGGLPRQHLDVYQPKGAKPGASVVIFFYGGYWSKGDKESYRFVGQAITSEGFVAVLPDYRLYPQVTFPAFVQDGAQAVKWVHDHAKEFGGDPTHIYLMGHSAGGHIAALLTLDDQYLKAVGLDRSNIRATCSLAGPMDFEISARLRPIFGAKTTTQPIDPSAEPINCVDGKAPPLLLIQGALDTTVEPGNATRMANRIKEKGGIVQVNIYNTQGHGGVVLALAAPFRWLAPVLDDASQFFRTH
jgi:acetyl esterase/lipase